MTLISFIATLLLIVIVTWNDSVILNFIINNIFVNPLKQIFLKKYSYKEILDIDLTKYSNIKEIEYIYYPKESYKSVKFKATFMSKKHKYLEVEYMTIAKSFIFYTNSKKLYLYLDREVKAKYEKDVYIDNIKKSINRMLTVTNDYLNEIASSDQKKHSKQNKKIKSLNLGMYRFIKTYRK